MNNPQNREETIFEAALQLPPEQRAAHLKQACGDDAQLRQRVERLLKSHEEASKDFLEQPPQALGPNKTIVVASPPIAEEQLGTMIGRYKLLEKIGEGGFGVVYVAEQREPVKRRVALKIIKLGMDTKQVVARFEVERQALAMMDHPNIAKVFDAGATETGRPYFVMELVRGIKITDYCDQNNLSTRERLELFAKVCQAIQHAHQKGIIHRDIKPSNILVTLHDGVPVPKVIDFGIAKATQGELTQKTVYTQLQQFIGTPAYMSPEQAEMSGLDIDTRSDIYALGVLLYELLTGKTPFDQKDLLSAGLDGMRRMIREQEPLRPSTRVSSLQGEERTTTAKRHGLDAPKLVHLLRGDLDWIVMKCLEKDRTRRYETANGVAMDLKRYLSQEPVVARPPSAIYRFQKFARRNKLVFATASVVIASLVTGLGVSTWMFFEERHARQRAVAAEQEQARLRNEAEAEKQTAQTEAAKNEQVSRFMQDILKGVGPSVAMGRDTTMLREILDKTVARVGAELTNQPEARADIRWRLSQTYADLGDFETATNMAQVAVDDYRLALGDRNAKLARALGELGELQVHLGSIALGQTNAQLALDMARKCGDTNILIECLERRAHSVRPAYIFTPDSTPFLREALTLRRKLGNDPDNLSWCMRTLALTLGGNELAEGESLAREALALDRQRLGEKDTSVANDLFILGQILLQRDKFDDAAETLGKAVDLFGKIYDKKHPFLLVAKKYLTEARVQSEAQRGEWSESEIVLSNALAESSGDVHLMRLLGDLHVRQDDWPQAADWYSRAADLDKDPFSSFGLAIILLKAGRYDDYRQYCHTVLERVANTRSFGVAGRAANVSLLRPLDGLDLERACQLADFSNTATEPKAQVAWGCVAKALAEYRRGHFEAAENWASRVKEEGGTPQESRAEALFVQAMACAHLHLLDAAHAALAKGIELSKKPADYPFTDWSAWRGAELLHDEAAKLIADQATSVSSQTK